MAAGPCGRPARQHRQHARCNRIRSRVRQRVRPQRSLQAGPWRVTTGLPRPATPSDWPASRQVARRPDERPNRGTPGHSCTYRASEDTSRPRVTAPDPTGSGCQTASRRADLCSCRALMHLRQRQQLLPDRFGLIKAQGEALAPLAVQEEHEGSWCWAYCCRRWWRTSPAATVWARPEQRLKF